MKTFKKVKPQAKHNGVVLPAPYEVRTPTRYGGCVVTRHMSKDEAVSRIRQLQRLGEVGEIVGFEQPADRAACPSGGDGF